MQCRIRITYSLVASSVQVNPRLQQQWKILPSRSSEADQHRKCCSPALANPKKHSHKCSHELACSAKAFVAPALLLLLLQSPALFWNDAMLQQDHLLPNLTLQTQRRIPHGKRLEEKEKAKAWQSYADANCSNWLAPPRLRSWQLCSQQQLCMEMCWNLTLAGITTVCRKLFFATSGL